MRGAHEPRPLILDIGAMLLPLTLAAGIFALGRSLPRWPRPVRFLLIALSLAVIAGGGAALLGALPTALDYLFSRLGGGTLLLGQATLLLFGAAWSAPRRNASTGFLACLAALAFLLIAVESSGPLLWRSAWADTWKRFANERGSLYQSSGMTCGPTAAVMLLHSYGITVSEGEMAYWARTTPFGTDAWSLARGLD